MALERRHFVFVFLSSRRRHTRFKCDWSSDVCSSDLTVLNGLALGQALEAKGRSARVMSRSEEHTSELQSHLNLVCRLLLEKKDQIAGNLDIHRRASRPLLVACGAPPASPSARVSVARTALGARHIAAHLSCFFFKHPAPPELLPFSPPPPSPL